MSSRLEFEAWEQNGLYTYRYVGKGRALYDHTWSEPDVLRYYVDEAALTYLALIWRLLEQRQLYAVPRYYREAGMRAAGEPYALVDWEYDVEAGWESQPGRLRGYVPAKSSVRSFPPPGPWPRENRGRAGFFEIHGFWVLEKVLRGLCCDAAADLNLYALADRDTVDPLVEKLRTCDAPEVGALLGTGDLFVNLSLGIDEPGEDSLVIHSRTQISDGLNSLVEEYRGVIDAYNEQAPSFASQDEWAEYVAKMLGPQIAAFRRVQRF